MMNATRRQFLSAALGASVVSLAPTVPQFLREAAAGERLSGENILVVVQLYGGNDGLNTIVPFADEAYYRNRPQLAIAKEQVLKINAEQGFHPSMRGCADLLENGRLAVIQGVGYPNPNRSHFESMDIWHTCRRKDEARPDGWLGRYLDRSYRPSESDASALHVGAGVQPFALMAQRVRVPSVRSIDRFRFQGDPAVRSAAHDLVAINRHEENDLLGFVQSTTTTALTTSERIEQASQGYQPSVRYPSSAFAEQLRLVAQLIDAGLTTRIYYLELGGFDTHANQAQTHAGLLEQVSSGLSAFLADLDSHGHVDRVAVVCFSEFGRRVQENASEGTDHGAAGPIFVASPRVNPGLIGPHPSLTDLEDGDLRHHTDFRQVYAALLEHWLSWDSESVLGGEFSPIPLFKG